MIDFVATSFLTDPALIWPATIALYVAGLAGCIFPILPGHLLIFLAMLTNRFILGEPNSAAPWWFLAAIAILFIACQIAEFLMSSAGAKRFGGSRWGAIGAFIGTIAGLFFFPIGLFLGPLLGAFIGELIFQKSTLRQAGKSGLGSMIGNVSSIIMKLLVAIIAISAHLYLAGSHPT